MLHTQIYGADGYSYGGLGGLGALVSSPAITSLQNYLKSIGRYSTTVTGTMNDATMAAVFDLFIGTAATVAKIPLLPSDVRGVIDKVVSALKTADSKIKSVSFGQASLSSVIKNWVTINAAVRLISGSAADAMASAREAVYNAVGGYASYIEKALRIFFPPAAPAQTSTQMVATALPISMIMTALKPGATATAAAPSAAAAPSVPPGSLYAWSPKLGKYRIAVPKTAGLSGVGIMGAYGNCIFGDCGLGATATHSEIAPSSTPPAGAVPTTETKVEAATGQLKFYKNWKFWTAVGGGVAVVGTGTAILLHRRKKAKAA